MVRSTDRNSSIASRKKAQPRRLERIDSTSFMHVGTSTVETSSLQVKKKQCDSPPEIVYVLALRRFGTLLGNPEGSTLDPVCHTDFLFFPFFPVTTTKSSIPSDNSLKQTLSKVERNGHSDGKRNNDKEKQLVHGDACVDGLHLLAFLLISLLFPKVRVHLK